MEKDFKNLWIPRELHLTSVLGKNGFNISNDPLKWKINIVHQLLWTEMRIDFGDKRKMQRYSWVADESKRIKHHWTIKIISDMCHSLPSDSCFGYDCSIIFLSCHGKKLKALYCDTIPGSSLWHMPDHDLPRWSCIFQTQPCAEFYALQWNLTSWNSLNGFLFSPILV